MRHALFALFVLVCALALTTPLFAPVQARMPLLLLGVPFSLVWVVGWVVASFLALLSYHLTDERR